MEQNTARELSTAGNKRPKNAATKAADRWTGQSLTETTKELTTMKTANPPRFEDTNPVEAQVIIDYCRENAYARANGKRNKSICLNPTESIRGVTKIGRNEPCLCGSGKKFKKCCIMK